MTAEVRNLFMVVAYCGFLFLIYKASEVSRKNRDAQWTAFVDQARKAATG